LALIAHQAENKGAAKIVTEVPRPPGLALHMPLRLYV